MYADGASGGTRQKARRDLLRHYVRLQRDLVDADPTSISYGRTINAFRHMGYVLISSGFEEDLDRLLRLRVLEGGQPARTPVSTRTRPVELHLIEQRRTDES